MYLRTLIVSASLCFGIVTSEAACNRGKSLQRLNCLSALLDSHAKRDAELARQLAELAKSPVLPEGTIIATSKNIAATPPKGWVVCNTLNDGRFLRGGTPLNELAGADRHSHLVSRTGVGNGDGHDKGGGNRELGASDEKSNLPPYMNVLFLCKADIVVP